MTNQEMLTIVKMRGWRLRSRVEWPDTRKRKWYVMGEDGKATVSPRKQKGLALRWAVALITEDDQMQRELLMGEDMDSYNEWRIGRESRN